MAESMHSSVAEPFTMKSSLLLMNTTVGRLLALNIALRVKVKVAVRIVQQIRLLNNRSWTHVNWTLKRWELWRYIQVLKEKRRPM